MAIIKSYTDLEQSKRLAEILPIETADMCYKKGRVAVKYLPESICYKYARELLYADCVKLIPCWSLAALLEVLPKGEYEDIDLCFGGYNNMIKFVPEWFCSYEQQEPVLVKVCSAQNAIDACYELILKLHELKKIGYGLQEEIQRGS